jgi:methyl-accepting chemotaxis protein
VSAIFLLIGAIFAGFATVSLSSVSAMNVATSELADRWLAGVSVVDDIVSHFKDERLAIAKHVLSDTPEGMTEQEKVMNESASELEVLLGHYEALKPSKAEMDLVQSFKTGLADYNKVRLDVVALSRKNENEAALKMYNETLTPFGMEIGAVLEKLAEIQDQGAVRANVASDDAFASASLMVWTVAGIAALVIIAGIVFALRGVVAPITRITGAMKVLAAGNTDLAIPFGGRSDEIGDMAGAVEVFRQAAIANKRLEAEAEVARRQAEADRIAAQQQAEADAAERLRIATSGLATGLQRLSGGDLSFQLNDAFAPDFEALRHDFNASVRQLAETLSAVSQSVRTMDNGTREISAGANDLSKRTEQQAASLEETAAALDEITANVKSSTQRTDEAQKVAHQANDAADKSAEVVGRAEDAMKRIEESSGKIANIIGVIDEIAFQTNLLALNAGVEAARAGEAGKGFAVVAQEVRELAQRAAAAAKEIKGLIQTSSTEVEGGVRLVRDASDALKTIGEYIAEMNGHMQAIATSAKEQSTGLAEVNVAVNSMDQTTQQNAAMVEQSNAAAASLAVEADRLQQLVARFALGNTGASNVAVLKQAAQTMARAVQPRSATQPSLKVAGASRQAADSWEEF